MEAKTAVLTHFRSCTAHARMRVQNLLQEGKVARAQKQWEHDRAYVTKTGLKPSACSGFPRLRRKRHAAGE